jgi:hypothetical protein
MPLGRWQLASSKTEPPHADAFWQACYAARLPKREDRPIWNAMRDALLKCCVRIDSIWSNRPSAEALTEARVNEWLSELATAIAEFRELDRWLEDEHVLTLKNALPWLQQLDTESAKELLKGVGRKPSRGHPIERRDIAIRAFEMKTSNEDDSWADVAARLCPCQNVNHNRGCAEAIRRNVARLKLVLQKYSISY